MVPRRSPYLAPSKLVFSFRSVVSADASRKAIILSALEPMPWSTSLSCWSGCYFQSSNWKCIVCIGKGDIMVNSCGMSFFLLLLLWLLWCKLQWDGVRVESVNILAQVTHSNAAWILDQIREIGLWIRLWVWWPPLTPPPNPFFIYLFFFLSLFPPLKYLPTLFHARATHISILILYFFFLDQSLIFQIFNLRI